MKKRAPTGRRGPGAEITLWRQFLARPGQTGAIKSSSARLAERIVAAADLAHASTIVELGPGTGAITERLIRALPPAATFFAIEINAEFARATRRRCPGIDVYEDSATNIGRYLALHGRSRCDRIVSSLPWASFAAPLQDALLDAITAVLEPGGRLVTYAYVTGLFLSAGRRFRARLATRFRSVEFDEIVWKNLPPAFIYTAQM